MKLKPQIIMTPEGNELVVVPREEYEQLKAMAHISDEEDDDDVALYDARRAELVSGQDFRLNNCEALIDAIDAAQALAGAGGIARGELETLTSDEVSALIDATTPLAFWRVKRGYTQAELATAIGISQSYVAALESGASKGDPELFLRLSQALKVPLAYLILANDENDALKFNE